MKGIVLYRGPSQLDGKPIVVIATGFEGSKNEKTGAMIQTWIMREDIAPHNAVKSGEDVSVCGDCPNRGTSCYVLTFQAPLVVWKAYHRGIYSEVITVAKARQHFAGRSVRIGAYGDPAAVPAKVWHDVATWSESVTGYTHQWRNPEIAYLKGYCMASCDSKGDREEAKRLGWRTFRVTTDLEREDREIICPATTQAELSCAMCKACGGHGAKARCDVVIEVHGPVIKVNAFRHRFA